MCGCPLGWVLGITLVVVGSLTAIMGANEVIDGMNGGNLIKRTGKQAKFFGFLFTKRASNPFALCLNLCYTAYHELTKYA